jgi:hypothetical protein
VRLLLGGYLGLSLVTLVVVVALRGHSSVVTAAVWIRVVIVAVSALVTFLLAARAARGSRGAFRRVRIIATVMLVAIVAILAVPGDFPLWLKIEQGVCGLLLLGVALHVHRDPLRAAFSSAAPGVE